MSASKVYVALQVYYSDKGEIFPQVIHWKDGREFEIDRILDVRRAPSSVGGAGTRYTIKVLGQKRFLFCEDIYMPSGYPRWFIEAKSTGD